MSGTEVEAVTGSARRGGPQGLGRKPIVGGTTAPSQHRDISKPPVAGTRINPPSLKELILLDDIGCRNDGLWLFREEVLLAAGS